MSRSPSAISVAEIVVAMDGPVAITACVDGADDPCNVQAGCLLRGSWDAVNSAIEGALKGVTLEEMLAPLFRFSVSKSSELEVHS